MHVKGLQRTTIPAIQTTTTLVVASTKHGSPTQAGNTFVSMTTGKTEPHITDAAAPHATTEQGAQATSESGAQATSESGAQATSESGAQATSESEAQATTTSNEHVTTTSDALDTVASTLQVSGISTALETTMPPKASVPSTADTTFIVCSNNATNKTIYLGQYVKLTCTFNYVGGASPVISWIDKQGTNVTNATTTSSENQIISSILIPGYFPSVGSFGCFTKLSASNYYCTTSTISVGMYNTLQFNKTSIYIALWQKQVLHESALCCILSHSTKRIDWFSILT